MSKGPDCDYEHIVFICDTDIP